jgi:hypothetical protein
MITMLGSKRRCCDGMTRRETLRAGALTALGGFSLADLMRVEAAAETTRRDGKAKNVMLLFLLGGAPTQDMWDLKPDAPDGIRGEFKPVATNVPGIQISEHLPRTAKWLHKMAIVRSLTHKAGCHNTLPCYTGYEVPVVDNTITKDGFPPSMGSVCEWLRLNGGDTNPTRQHGTGAAAPHGGPNMPAYFYLPCYLGWGQAIRRAGPYGGFLGKRHDPIFTECSPYMDKDAPAPAPGSPRTVRGDPFLPNSVLEGGLTIDALNSRRTLLDQIDEQLRRGEAQQSFTSFDRYQQRAFDVLTSSTMRAAFDLSSEDPKVLDRYGRTLFGSSTLIGRRLIEAGVQFVNVTWDLFWDRIKIDYDAWDTHTKNFAILKDNKLPGLDLTYTALLEDLESRGLLDETLVVITSEMGRTPKINGNAGRDHWTFCYSTVFAGAGIRGGSVYGASDAHAAYVKDKPVSTSDICATIYHCLGIDPDMTVPDRTGRPVPIAHGGQPIREILT